MVKEREPSEDNERNVEKDNYGHLKQALFTPFDFNSLSPPKYEKTDGSGSEASTLWDTMVHHWNLDPDEATSRIAKLGVGEDIFGRETEVTLYEMGVAAHLAATGLAIDKVDPFSPIQLQIVDGQQFVSALRTIRKDRYSKEIVRGLDDFVVNFVQGLPERLTHDAMNTLASKYNWFPPDTLPELRHAVENKGTYIEPLWLDSINETLMSADDLLAEFSRLGVNEQLIEDFRIIKEAHADYALLEWAMLTTEGIFNPPIDAFEVTAPYAHWSTEKWYIVDRVLHQLRQSDHREFFLPFLERTLKTNLETIVNRWEKKTHKKPSELLKEGGSYATLRMKLLELYAFE